MRRMCRAGVGWVMALLLLAAAGEAVAQNSGVVVGHVLDDSTDEAIAGAQVQLLSANRRVLHTTTAGASGEFSIPIRRRGEYRLRATRVGYRESVSPTLGIDFTDSLGVEMRMTTGRILLAPLQVVARPARRHRAPGLDNFRNRMESSVGGRFVTRDDVDTRRNTRLVDILAAEGLVVTNNNVYFPRNGCPPSVFVDGVLMTRHTSGRRAITGLGQSPYEVINMVWTGDVEGVELYQGRSSIPAEFGGPGSECGVVAIWTRRFEP
jgi:hypothetical protein